MKNRKFLYAIMAIAMILGCSDSGVEPPTSGGGTLAPTLSITDIQVAEGSDAVFTVTLSDMATSTVRFSHSTSPGTATALDYTAVTNVNDSITAGNNSTTITISTINDTDVEPTEMFSVVLSSMDFAFTNNDSTAVCTILDNDSLPSLQIENTTVTEGDTAKFIVNLSIVQSSNATVYYHTVDVSATASLDYTAITAGSQVLLAGDTTMILNVLTINDTIVENPESFSIILDSSSLSLELLVDSATCIIIDNDTLTSTVSYSGDIKPMLDSVGCAAPGCHGSGVGGNGLHYTTNYNDITTAQTTGGINIIVPFRSDSSLIYLRTTDFYTGLSRMPRGTLPLSVAQQNLIRDWIDEGAQNN